MKETEFKPVRLDLAAMLEQALEKRGFRAAYDALEEEYAHADGGRLEIRIVSSGKAKAYTARTTKRERRKSTTRG